MALSIKPNRFYPNVPAPGKDLDSIHNAVEQMRTAMLTHERRDNNYNKSFVRFEELVELGIIDSAGNSTLSSGTGGENQTPWLSDIDGAGFGLDNIDRLNIDGPATQSTTMQYSGNNMELTVANTTDLIFTGFVGGDFIVKGGAGGGYIRQENAADSSEYIQIYHDTSQTARVLTSGTLRLQSTNTIVGKEVQIAPDNTFVVMGGAGTQEMTHNHDGTDYIMDGSTGSGADVVDVTIQGFSGNVNLGNYIFTANQTLTSGEDNYVLTYDFAGNTIQLEPGGGSSDTLSDVTARGASTTDETTFSGGLLLEDSDVNRPVLEDYGVKHQTATVSANAVTVDCTLGNSVYIDMDPATADVTLTLSNPSPSGTYCEVSLVIQMGTPAYDITWPGSITWQGGSAPTLTTTDNVVDLVHLFTVDGGTTWYGTAATAAGGFTHPTHTGEVTGTLALTVDVSSITNRTAVTEVSDSGVDDVALHDASDGSFKKTPVNLITDGGYF